MEDFEFSDPTTWAEISTYTTRLYESRGEAQIVPRLAVAIAGTAAEPNHCHDNAQCYVDETPGSHVVHGWICIDSPLMIIFVAHSVVRLPDGTLVDVTPSEVAGYPFLSAATSAHAFAGLVNILTESSGQARLVRSHT